MDNSSNLKQVSVYVVSAWHDVNDRVEKLSKLSPLFGSLKLVHMGRKSTVSDGDSIRICPISNPTNILNIFKLNKLKSYIDRYLFFPSTNIFFVWSAKKTLNKYISRDIRKGKNITILICLPPHDLSILGIYLKKRYSQIKLVVDWQDLWSYDENYLNRVPKIYHKRLYKLENELMKICDMNITTNKNAKEVLESKYKIPATRTYSIEHHFDPEDHPELQDRMKNLALASHPPRKGAIRIGFLGALFKPPRVPGHELLKTIKTLNVEEFNIELHIHGPISEEFKKLISRCNLSNTIFLHDPVGHIESVKKLVDYDYLLLLLADMPNSRAVMSIKLPHYLMIGKPILAIVPSSSAIAKIVKETGSGYVIDSSKEWSDQLVEILRDANLNINIPKRNLKNIEYYSWDNLSVEWLNMLSGDILDKHSVI